MAVSYTDRQLVKRALVGLLAGMNLSDAIAAAAQVNSDYFVFSKAAADGMASTATTETDCNIFLKRACIIKSVAWIPTGAAVTNDNTNNFTLTVSKRDAGGANLTTIATLTNTVTAYGATAAQRAAQQAVLTAANVAVVAGSTLTYSIAKNGSGVVVPVSMFVVEVEWDG